MDHEFETLIIMKDQATRARARSAGLFRELYAWGTVL
jgi:hypothetical protein